MSFTIGVEYSVITCCKEECGFQFALPFCFTERLKENHNSFYCPKCRTGQFFPQKSDKEILESKLKRVQEERDFFMDQSSRNERRLTAHKGVITKVKKKLNSAEQRVANGVCPCCNKSFKNVRLHMRSKHPGFIKKLEKKKNGKRK